MTIIVRSIAAQGLDIDTDHTLMVADISIPGFWNYKEDQGHALGGALSVEWEGRDPLLVVAEILPWQCG